MDVVPLRPPGAAHIDPAAEQAVLAAHGLGTGALLGAGTEARVHALDDATVLKIYAGHPVRRAQLELLAQLYDGLDERAAPFALPLIHRIDESGGLLLVRERRIRGRPMHLGPEQEATYLDVAAALSALTVPMQRCALLDPDSPAEWHAHLRALVTTGLSAGRPLLQADVPQLDRLVGELLERFATPYPGPYRLVHGDLCPDNVLVDDDGTVAGVIDFGVGTMRGDPRYDVATACVYADMYGPDRQATRRHLLRAAADRLGGGGDLLVAYAQVAALTTCLAYPERGVAPRRWGHYRWAVDLLCSISSS